MADVTPATNATNHTTYYNLPLFISTDRPSWLVDWNGAMNEIDTILNDIAIESEGASGAVATIQTQINTLSTTVQNLNTIVETAVSDVASMQTTVASHETRMDSIEADLITQNNLIKTLSDTVVAMQATVAALNNRVTAIESTVSAHGVDLSALNTAVSSLDTRVTALENGGTTGGGMPALSDFGQASVISTLNIDTSKAGPIHEFSNDAWVLATFTGSTSSAPASDYLTRLNVEYKDPVNPGYLDARVMDIYLTDNGQHVSERMIFKVKAEESLVLTSGIPAPAQGATQPYILDLSISYINID